MVWEGTSPTIWDERSFLADPGRVSDWRMVVLVEAAADTGLLAHLPATTAALVDRLDLDEQAVRVVLEALACWAVVEVDHDGMWTPGPDTPSPDAIAVLGHHARAIRLWSKSLDDRLRGLARSDPRPGPEAVDRMLEALAVNGQESVPGAVDACLERTPVARRVLDLGGGHGEYALEFARRGLETTMQDQEHVIDGARARGRLAGAGVGLFGGSFFDLFPDERFDLVFCAGVTYTFDAARNTELYLGSVRSWPPGAPWPCTSFCEGLTHWRRSSPYRCCRADEVATPTARMTIGAGWPRPATERSRRPGWPADPNGSSLPDPDLGSLPRLWSRSAALRRADSAIGRLAL